MSNSLDDFIRDALRDHDDGGAATSTAAAEVRATGPLGELPGHVVEDLIARGGMGVVYRARQQALEREVAVKVMTRHAASPGMAARFRREALVLGRLAHPNIVPVYDIGTDDDGQLYYTMKLVRGRTLQAILDELRQENAEALRLYPLALLLTIFRKVCDAMAFAHSQGVLHRDLKPENIMVGEFGEVLVMDWGIAKVKAEMGKQKAENEPAEQPAPISAFSFPISHFSGTLQGAVMGTPQYMSPEQARGEIDALDERSDIFALGGILYAMLTLRPPVEGATLEEVLEKVRTGSILPPTAHGAATALEGKPEVKGTVLEARKITPLPHITGGRVPQALSAVVMKALRVQKAERFPSVGEFSADIDAYQAGFATKAEDAGLAKQLLLLIRRNRGAFATAGAALLVILLLGAGFVWSLRAKEQRAVAGEQTALREKDAARRSAADASLNLAEAALREADGLLMQSALEAVPADLRDTTWGYLKRQSDSSVARIRLGGSPLAAVAADPSRPGVFALADESGTVTLMKVRTGERLLEFRLGFADGSGGSRYRIAFSPDGLYIAAGCSRGPWDRKNAGGVVIHRARDGGKEREWAAPPTEGLEFGRADALLRYGGASLEVWDPATGQARWKEEIFSNIGVRGTFTPDGAQIVKFTNKDRLRLVNADDGSLVHELGGRPSAYDWRMAVRPDGKAVVTWNETQIIECVSLEDGRTIFALPGRKDRRHLGFSRDGAMLFTASPRDQGGQSIEVWNAQTGELLRDLLGGQGPISGMDAHPLSHELVVVGADSRAWDTTGPAAAFRLPSLPGGNVAFWGEEDWVFGYVSRPAQWGLHRLKEGGLEQLWKYDSPTGAVAETSADGSLAVVIRAGWRGDVALFHRKDGKVEPFRSFVMEAPYYRIRPSPQGTRVALMGRSRETIFQVYDMAGKVAVRLARTGVQRISDLEWLGEERLLALLTVRAARGEPGSEENLVLWDSRTGEVLRSAVHPTAMEALAVSPDGQRFAEAGADKLVRIRDAATLEVRQQFRAHDAPITTLAWHPSQPLIATGSEDRSIKVWNLETGRLMTEYHDMLHPPDYLVFSPSGRLLATRTQSDHGVRVWQFGADTLESAPVPAQTPRPERTAEPKVTAAGAWEDALAMLTPEVVAETGNGWRKERGELLSPGRRASLPLPIHLGGQSYQVRVKLRRLKPGSAFHLDLPVGGSMVGFELEAWPKQGTFTGLDMVNGQGTKSLPGAVRGRLLKDFEPHMLEVTVRLAGEKATISTMLDGRPLYEWSGPASELSQSRTWETPPGQLALGAVTDDWCISEVKVMRLP